MQKVLMLLLIITACAGNTANTLNCEEQRDEIRDMLQSQESKFLIYYISCFMEETTKGPMSKAAKCASKVYNADKNKLFAGKELNFVKDAEELKDCGKKFKEPEDCYVISQVYECMTNKEVLNNIQYNINTYNFTYENIAQAGE